MDNLNLGNEKYPEIFNNQDIDYQHKTVVLGALLHGTVDVNEKRYDKVANIIFFKPDKTPYINLCYTFGKDDSMAKNNAKVFLNEIEKNFNVGKTFENLVDKNKVSLSEKEIIALCAKENLNRLNVDGAKKEYDNFISKNLDVIFEYSKDQYPNILTDEFVKSYKDMYPVVLEEISKKKDLKSEQTL